MLRNGRYSVSLKILNDADDPRLRLKSELIKEFLREVVPSLKNGANIAAEYLDFEEQQMLNELDNFSNEQNYPKEKLSQLLSEYQYSGQIYRRDIGAPIKDKYLIKKRKIDKIHVYVREVTEKYGV